MFASCAPDREADGENGRTEIGANGPAADHQRTEAGAAAVQGLYACHESLQSGDAGDSRPNGARRGDPLEQHVAPGQGHTVGGMISTPDDALQVSWANIGDDLRYISNGRT